MDATRFDSLFRALFSRASRRCALAGLTGGLLAISPLALSGDGAEAKKKRKKTKKPSLNAFGCVNSGQACGGNHDLCCSGICEGKKPKKGRKDKSRCVAHNVLGCPAGADSCVQVVACGTNGFCQQTTGAASFCAGFSFPDCTVSCTRDADCEATRGPGAACVVCASGCPASTTICVPAGA